MNVYHLINCFFVFSFFGYLLECVVLSYEYRTPVINRGFGHGPFCIIYGFGALGACLFLQPFASQTIKLYFATTIMATSMELVTAHMMIRLFGSFWWDYSHKPFNYKGIICLESTIAWGFYAIIIVTFLHKRVLGLVDSYDMEMGIWVCRIVFLLVTADYLIKLMQIFNISLKEQKDRLVDAYEAFRARWY